MPDPILDAVFQYSTKVFPMPAEENRLKRQILILISQNLKKLVFKSVTEHGAMFYDELYSIVKEKALIEEFFNIFLQKKPDDPHHVIRCFFIAVGFVCATKSKGRSIKLDFMDPRDEQMIIQSPGIWEESWSCARQIDLDMDYIIKNPLFAMDVILTFYTLLPNAVGLKFLESELE